MNKTRKIHTVTIKVEIVVSATDNMDAIERSQKILRKQLGNQISRMRPVFSFCPAVVPKVAIFA